MTTSPPPEREAVLDQVRHFREQMRQSLAAIEDPVARERTARAVQEELGEAVVDVGRARQDAVKELRVGRTLAEVGALLGLSVPRVGQLAKGK